MLPDATISKEMKSHNAISAYGASTRIFHAFNIVFLIPISLYEIGLTTYLRITLYIILLWLICVVGLFDRQDVGGYEELGAHYDEVLGANSRNLLRDPRMEM